MEFQRVEDLLAHYGGSPMPESASHTIVDDIPEFFDEQSVREDNPTSYYPTECTKDALDHIGACINSDGVVTSKARRAESLPYAPVAVTAAQKVMPKAMVMPKAEAEAKTLPELGAGVHLTNCFRGSKDSETWHQNQEVPAGVIQKMQDHHLTRNTKSIPLSDSLAMVHEMTVGVDPKHHAAVHAAIMVHTGDKYHASKEDHYRALARAMHCY